MENNDMMIGKRFTRLVVISRVDDYVSPSGGKHIKYLCRCDCGTEKAVLKEHLTSGRQKSCGCLRHENGKPTHRQSNTRLYRIWGNMVNRCTNKNNPAYQRYGRRGIFVCKDWLHFEPFEKWARKNGYNNTLTLDRIDNDRGYEPENCRWATAIVQGNNKRSNHLITYQGETKTIAEWAVKSGIPYKTLHRRIKSLQWDISRALSQPVRYSKQIAKQ